MRCIRVERGDETVLRIEGTLDALSAPVLRSVANALIDEWRSSVTLDLSALHLIDSVGVAVLVSLYKRLMAQGGSVSAVGLCAQPLAIFRLLRLDKRFSSVGPSHDGPGASSHEHSGL